MQESGVRPLDLLAQRFEQTAVEEEKQLEKLEKYANDYRELAQLVQSLPEKTSHQIMIPFGPAAFIPGRLVHTNEFLVLLGSEYYAEMSAKQTVELLKRREVQIAETVRKGREATGQLRSRKDAVGTVYEAQDGTFDIVEPYEPERYKAERAEAAAASSSSAAVPAAAAGYPTGGSNGVTDAEYDDLLKRLSAMEAAEAAAEATEAAADAARLAAEGWSGEQHDTFDEDSDDDPDVVAAVRAREEGALGAARAQLAAPPLPPPRSPGEIAAYERAKSVAAASGASAHQPKVVSVVRETAAPGRELTVPPPAGAAAAGGFRVGDVVERAPSGAKQAGGGRQQAEQGNMGKPLSKFAEARMRERGELQ